MSDMDYIATPLIDLLNLLQKAETADSQTEALAMITDGYDPWMNAGYPLLTTRARAVLEAVEKQMVKCESCFALRTPAERRCRDCDWGPIRKAMEKKP